MKPLDPLLVAKVSHHGRRQGMTDAERSVAGFPVEAGKPPVAVHPKRGIGLYHLRASAVATVGGNEQSR